MCVSHRGIYVHRCAKMEKKDAKKAVFIFATVENKKKKKGRDMEMEMAVDR